MLWQSLIPVEEEDGAEMRKMSKERQERVVKLSDYGCAHKLDILQHAHRANQGLSSQYASYFPHKMFFFNPLNILTSNSAEN